jgi:NodT family efflux transporter outer membrane factor (OMF) lipoprotein
MRRKDAVVRVLLLCLIGCIPLLCACKVGPNYSEPQPRIDQQWMQPGSEAIQRGQTELSRWWEVFNDPVLNTLVQKASDDNPSLHAAAVRVLQSRAARGIAIGLLFPQQQEAFGDFTGNQTSEHRGIARQETSRVLNRINWVQRPLGTALQKRFAPGIDNNFTNWQFGLSVAWELDVWGRFRRGIEAADAELLASIAGYDDVLVSLIAEVASNYVLLRTQEEQLDITRANVAIQKRGLELAQTKAEGGTVTQLDPAQALALLRDTESEIPVLEASVQQTQNTLCVLLGIPPKDLSELLAGRRLIPSPPDAIRVGVPADLLRRRPDIRRAERLLQSLSARIGIATADLLPSFSLNGDIGLSAEHFPDLFRGNSFDAFGGPSFRWAVLNYGRIENNVRVQDAAFQAALSDYEALVLRAQGEVESSIAGFLGSQRQIVSLADSNKAATRAVDLAEQQYRGGITDYTRVLNTQQFLINEQFRLVATRSSVALNLVTLYRTLGGGWEFKAGQALVPDAIKAQMRERTHWGHMLKQDLVEPVPATSDNVPATQPVGTPL